GRRKMQDRLADLAAPQPPGQRRLVFDTGLVRIEQPVEQVEQGLAAEIAEARFIRPDDPGSLAVPQPGRLRQVPQILERWQSGLIHLFRRRPWDPRPLV